MIGSKYHALTQGHNHIVTRVHVAMYRYNSTCFKWNIDKNILISAFLPKVCAVTGGGRSGGMVIVAESGMDDVSAGMMVKEGGY